MILICTLVWIIGIAPIFFHSHESKQIPWNKDHLENQNVFRLCTSYYSSLFRWKTGTLIESLKRQCFLLQFNEFYSKYDRNFPIDIFILDRLIIGISERSLYIMAAILCFWGESEYQENHWPSNGKLKIHSKLSSECNSEPQCRQDSDYTLQKTKIAKILNSEENSKRKVPNQMAKSKAQTHQTN